MSKHIAIFSSTPKDRPSAEQLANDLALPLITRMDERYDYLLVMTDDYLGLQKTKSTANPIRVDFCHKKTLYRIAHASLKKEAIARAFGLKKGMTPRIIDATGGLGGDSLILAALGFAVTLLERSPIVHALLNDGIARARHHPLLNPIMDKLNLIHTDAISWLGNLSDDKRPEMIYLDPMFPERKKSALPKQEMLIFQDIVGDDDDAALLLHTALTCARKRVVVKRPRLATSISASPAPSFNLMGNSCRFDVYLR